jgi:hypothetical protein
MPVPAAVPIPFVSGMLDEQGDFEPTDPVSRGTGRMFDSIAEWTEVLRPLREA